jgi:hypothetical protein
MKKFALITLFLLPLPLFAQSVDLLYAGNTYTPPFYPGGALWSGESTVTFFAVPQGLGDPATLNYKWRQGTTVLGDLSGVGRSTLTLADTIFSKPVTISVEIVDASGAGLASTFARIAPSAPGLLVYEDNPLYGFLFNHEVSGAYTLPDAETTFGAFPLFFSVSSRLDPNLTYSWRSSAGVDSTASLVTYRAPAGVSGQASISLEAANPATLRQEASRNFLIQFGNENRQ